MKNRNEKIIDLKVGGYARIDEIGRCTEMCIPTEQQDVCDTIIRISRSSDGMEIIITESAYDPFDDYFYTIREITINCASDDTIVGVSEKIGEDDPEPIEYASIWKRYTDAISEVGIGIHV